MSNKDHTFTAFHPLLPQDDIQHRLINKDGNSPYPQAHQRDARLPPIRVLIPFKVLDLFVCLGGMAVMARRLWWTEQDITFPQVLVVIFSIGLIAYVPEKWDQSPAIVDTTASSSSDVEELKADPTLPSHPARFDYPLAPQIVLALITLWSIAFPNSFALLGLRLWKTIGRSTVSCSSRAGACQVFDLDMHYNVSTIINPCFEREPCAFTRVDFFIDDKANDNTMFQLCVTITMAICAWILMLISVYKYCEGKCHAQNQSNVVFTWQVYETCFVLAMIGYIYVSLLLVFNIVMWLGYNVVLAYYPVTMYLGALVVAVCLGLVVKATLFPYPTSDTVRRQAVELPRYDMGNIDASPPHWLALLVAQPSEAWQWKNDYDGMMRRNQQYVYPIGIFPSRHLAYSFGVVDELVRNVQDFSELWENDVEDKDTFNRHFLTYIDAVENLTLVKENDDPTILESCIAQVRKRCISFQGNHMLIVEKCSVTAATLLLPANSGDLEAQRIRRIHVIKSVRQWYDQMVTSMADECTELKKQ